MIYGAKFEAITKLTRIYEIKELIKKGNSTEMLKVELVSLAYSLTAHKSRYKLPFEDKLISLGIKPTTSKNLPAQQASHFDIGPEINYSANSLPLTFLFVLGFFLGDGTLFLKLDWKTINSTPPPQASSPGR
jgi:hypothetical protein